MTGGSVTLNGITDAELVIILQHKEKGGKHMGFNPQVMQNAGVAANQPAMYNNIVLNFSGAEGLAVVIDTLRALQK